MKTGDDIITKNIGKSMRNYRELMDISVKEAAAVIGVSERTLRNYENGVSCIRPDKAIKAAGLYRTTLQKMLQFDLGKNMARKERLGRMGLDEPDKTEEAEEN